MYRVAPLDYFKAKVLPDLIGYFKWSYVAAVAKTHMDGMDFGLSLEKLMLKAVHSSLQWRNLYPMKVPIRA